MKPNKYNGGRPFETDYAGAWKGHCSTREGAINAAVRHITMDGYSRCTITDKRTSMPVARLALSTDKKAVHIYTETQLRKVR